MHFIVAADEITYFPDWGSYIQVAMISLLTTTLHIQMQLQLAFDVFQNTGPRKKKKKKMAQKSEYPTLSINLISK